MNRGHPNDVMELERARNLWLRMNTKEYDDKHNVPLPTAMIREAITILEPNDGYRSKIAHLINCSGDLVVAKSSEKEVRDCINRILNHYEEPELFRVEMES